MASNNVSVINTATNSVVATVNVGSSPAGVAVTPNGTSVYIANMADGTISVINTATNAISATITVGTAPGIVAVNPDGTRVYVGNNGSNTVSVVDTATNTVIGAPIPVGNSPLGLSVSPDGKRLYVANNASDTVSVIDTATNTTVATFGVGSQPFGVAVSPDGTRAYVTNNGNNTVSVVDTGTNTVVATVAVGTNPSGVSFSPDGTRAYVANQSSSDVFVIDTASNTVATIIPVGSVPIFPGICSNGNALLATGLTFTARTSGALACTLASGPSGSPGPVFTGGTLQFAGPNISSALPITLQAAGGTFDTNGNNATLSGTITGPGGLTKSGVGTLTLAGASSYAGTTFINAGILQAGALNAFSPFSAFTVAGGATLDLNSFNQSIGSLAGAGGVTLGSAMLTIGNDNTSTIFSGTIAGTGGLTKIGTGVMILTGASSYTGPTSVNAGILSVNGSLASTVFVSASGTLMGNGTVGGLNVASGGTAAPGNSIGTLSVAGNVSFGPGSIYQVETNAAGQSDKIVAGGTSTLTGGTVQVLAENGNYSRQTRYTLLTASGGVTGTFANVTSNLAFLTPTLSYDPNDVFLTLNRNDISFASLAQTPNQRNVAGALDRSLLFSPLVQAAINLSGVGALQAFDALSGEIHGSVQTTIIDDSRYIRQALLGRLRQAPYANETGAMAALGSGGPMLAYSTSAPAADYSTMAYGDARQPNFPIKAPPLAAPIQTADFTYWAQGVGAWGKINSDGNAADVSRNLGGFFTGFDRRFGDWRAGLAGGYTNSSISVNARASSANIDTGYLAAYAGTNYGPWNVRSGTAFAWNNISTSRSINFPGFAEQATTRYGAGEVQVFGELGYGVSFGQTAIEPFAGLAWVHLSTDSFTENGGISALNGSVNTSDVGYSTLGMRAASYYLLQYGMVFIPRASVAWQHAFGTVDPIAALAFVSTGAAFAIAGVPLARDAALVEAGADLQITRQAKIGLSYSGQLANSIQDHSVKGNFTWRF
jgi:outer membrane autotransporter protein